MHKTIRPIGARIKRMFLRKRVRYLSNYAWRKRHKKVFGLHPEYKQPCPKDIEKEHLALWRPLRPDVRVDTLRICFNISGNADPRMVPEEVYESEIEAALNRYDMCAFLANKNFLNRWVSDGLAPEAFLHNIGDDFYSGDYEPLDSADVHRVLDQIEYPVVIKPSMGSGGIDVCFPEDRNALEARMAGRKNYVVQRKIRQHSFFGKFSDSSLNTVRVCVYRSVSDNSMHVLNAAMRMGRGGALDNLTAGGIVRFVHQDGTLNHFALDKWGEKFDRHPDSGVDFTKTEVIPKFQELKGLAKRVAQHVYLTRLVSFDFCLDETARWRIVEINLRSQTIRMAQYAGRPFFKPFTQEVIDYCKENPRWTIVLPAEACGRG